MLSCNSIQNFDCLGKDCPNHCCGAYGAISDKLQSMSGVKFSEIILTDSDVQKIQNAGLERYILCGKDGLYRIKTHEDGACYALEDGKCAVYSVRPSICIAYPLYLDMFVGLCYLNECPAFSESISVSDTHDALLNLLDIYQYWIDYYRKQLEETP